jgi:hypothetical protein
MSSIWSNGYDSHNLLSVSLHTRDFERTAYWCTQTLLKIYIAYVPMIFNILDIQFKVQHTFQNGSALDTVLCHNLILHEQMWNPAPCHVFPNAHLIVYSLYNIFNQHYQLIYQYFSLTEFEENTRHPRLTFRQYTSYIVTNSLNISRALLKVLCYCEH